VKVHTHTRRSQMSDKHKQISNYQKRVL